ncbi:GNAT family N-acetyltransferase [Rufibacter roseus]|uniref:GNAT family N-acetyltransferase n=1 Tax=Rufibacter roseus TaxID=1567108 RepID=A0ABW2DN53_9BACT|nr:GNAT family N-acetyltransferase [Rufibacter roseus]
MEINHLNTDTNGHFEAIELKAQAGLLTYHWDTPQKMVIEHTEVNPAFSGRGVGRELVMAAVAYARAQQIKIVPLCPYARKLFKQDETIRDVLFKERLIVG